MSTEEVNNVHQEGPPWKIAARFPTFEKADIKRAGLLEEENLQVKVHWMGRDGADYFAVKTRLDPAMAMAESAAQKKSEKKRRQAKLNRKRRKK